MAEDWKAALEALRNSGAVPQDNTETEPGADDVDANQEARKDTLHLVMERKGRGGKTATIVEGFTLPDEEVEEIARRLKQKIGTGGSARGGEILLQGDFRAKAAELLRKEGFKVKGNF